MNNIIRNKPYYKGVTKDLKSPTQANKLTYTPGTIIEADDFNLDPDKDCGAGINFCSTLAGALKWTRGGTVVTVTVPDGEPIVDTGDKLRAKRVLVGEVVSLWNANLSGADLLSANLTGANLRDARGNEYTVLPKGYKVVDGYVVREAE